MSNMDATYFCKLELTLLLSNAKSAVRSSQHNPTWKVRLADQVRHFIASSIHFVRKFVRRELRGNNEHSTLISNATYSPWRVDEEFKSVFQSIAKYTLLDIMRTYEIWQLAAQVSHLDGDAIEVGCWRGGIGCMIAKRIANSPKKGDVFLCDTFRGVVKAGRYDGLYINGEHSDSSKDIVTHLISRLALKNVHILEGIFPEETGHDIDNRMFKFAHIDVDVYQGSRDAFEWLLPRLVDGAILVFDDYGSSSTNGIRTFINELQGRADVVIVRNLNGHAVVIKRSGSV